MGVGWGDTYSDCRDRRGSPEEMGDSVCVLKYKQDIAKQMGGLDKDVKMEWGPKCGGRRAGESTEALCKHCVFRKW